MSRYYGHLQPPEDFECAGCGETYNIDYLDVIDCEYVCSSCARADVEKKKEEESEDIFCFPQ